MAAGTISCTFGRQSQPQHPQHPQLEHDCGTLFRFLCLQVEWWVEAHWRWLDSCWDELLHIRQAIASLTEPQKQQLSLQEIGDELYLLLTTHQIY
jgi:hypothetical protein